MTKFIFEFGVLVGSLSIVTLIGFLIADYVDMRHNSKRVPELYELIHKTMRIEGLDHKIIQLRLRSIEESVDLMKETKNVKKR